MRTLRNKLIIWWLRHRIYARNVLLSDLQEVQDNLRTRNSAILIYMFELRDRNSIDHARIASLNYLGEKNYATTR